MHNVIHTTERGYRVRDVAGLLRIGRKRVMAEILGGRLQAVDVGENGKHRYVVLPEMLSEWISGRATKPAVPKPAKRRRLAAVRDFFPDD
jgi:hypothetical protein